MSQIIADLQGKVVDLKNEVSRLKKENVCPHCKMDKNIANPSGFCNHVHYPEFCAICNKRETLAHSKYDGVPEKEILIQLRKKEIDDIDSEDIKVYDVLTKK